MNSKMILFYELLNFCDSILWYNSARSTNNAIIMFNSHETPLHSQGADGNSGVGAASTAGASVIAVNF